MDSVDMDKYRGWLTKVQVADRLGRSLKTVQRLAAANRIGAVALRDPHAPGGEVWLYDPADVDRIAAGVSQAVRPAVLTADPTSNGNGHEGTRAIAAVAAEARFQELPASQVAAVAAIAAVVAREMSTLSTLSMRWLSIPEAAAATHRSEAAVRRAIQDKTLPAVKDRGWRIHPTDLAAWR